MDANENRAELENQKAILEQYFQHPVTVEVLRDLKEEQEGMLQMVLHPIESFETFFAHFEAIGELRGLRRTEAVLKQGLEEVKTKIKDL